jgi:hypothetical protein
VHSDDQGWLLRALMDYQRHLEVAIAKSSKKAKRVEIISAANLLDENARERRTCPCFKIMMARR